MPFLIQLGATYYYIKFGFKKLLHGSTKKEGSRISYDTLE